MATAVSPGNMLFGLIPVYGLLIVSGFVIAIILAAFEEKKVGLPKDTVLDLSLWIVPFSLIGARLFYVIFSWKTFASNPIRILYIWEGGLAIYGGVIAGIIVTIIFCKVRNLPILTVFDCFIPGLALAQGIGRWGNYFNMEAFGTQITNPKYCFFPIAVLANENGQMTWHMATFFYEFVLDVCIFIFLIISRRRFLKRKGDVFFFYLLLYAAGRLIIEQFRTDSLYSISSAFRISQIISVVICLLILIYFAIPVIRNSGLKKILPAIIPAFAGVPICLLYPRGIEPFTGYTASLSLLWMVIIFGLIIQVLKFVTSKKSLLVFSAVALVAAIFAVLFALRLCAAMSPGIKRDLILLSLYSLPAVLAGFALYAGISSMGGVKVVDSDSKG